MSHFHEHVSRSVFKTITFRVLVIATDSIIIFLITKRYDLTLGVLFFSNLTSTVLYFFHERFWNKIHWGKHINHHGKKRK